jgi:hypothetical protein
MSKKQMLEGGYDYEECLFGPEEGMTPLINKLKAEHIDGVIIGALWFLGFFKIEPHRLSLLLRIWNPRDPRCHSILRGHHRHSH